MLQGDIEISTVTILQSLICKIDDTLNGKSCENSDKSPCNSLANTNTNCSINTDSLSINPLPHETLSNTTVTSPAAFEEAVDTENAIINNDFDQSSCYDSLAKYIRVCSNINNDNMLSERSANIELSDISESETESVSNVNKSPSDNGSYPAQQISPYAKINGSPFHLFNAEALDEATKFTHHFSNSYRSAVYYGKYPYSYGSVSHAPKEFTENEYLLKVLSYIEIVLPDIRYNSAMIHKYIDGTAFIPHHSDNEPEIEDGSPIVTISFGGSRLIEFKNIETGSTICQKLSHGDVLVTETSSQKHFTHSILKSVTSNEMRLSVTLRVITPPDPVPQSNSPLSSLPGFSASTMSRLNEAGTSGIDESESPVTDGNPLTNTEAPCSEESADRSYPSSSQHPKSKTLFISDSMFRNLDESRLSSNCQTATKFFYPGAKASHILKKLQQDQDFNKLDKSSVKKVFILAGTNDIEDIYLDRNGGSLEKTSLDLRNLIKFISNALPNSVINVLNVLPRKQKGRCDIINAVNMDIKSLCSRVNVLNFIDTFSNRMFAHRDGARREEFFNQFSRFGADDPHLNPFGIVRLGKFLKYLVHNT